MKQYYSKKVIEHFMNPKNFGKIKNADGIGDTKNMRCGDIMKIYIKVEKKQGNEVIKDAKFETLGCGHAIATSDMICEKIKGKTLEAAKEIGYEDIKEDLGEFPQVKIHCVALAQYALKEAIEDYYKKSKKK